MNLRCIVCPPTFCPSYLMPLAALPRENAEAETQRKKDMLDAMGLNSAMEVDSIATSLALDMRAPGCEEGEIGSSPACFMPSVSSPARLRGGAQKGLSEICTIKGPVVQDRYLEVRRVGGAGGVAGGVMDRLNLRGGGNVLAMGSKYSAKERVLNKQLCGAVKRGDEKEIKRLVKEASPSARARHACQKEPLHAKIDLSRLQENPTAAAGSCTPAPRAPRGALRKRSTSSQLQTPHTRTASA